jgi:predicted kinase
MASAIRRDGLRREDVSATARTIARFHAAAARPPVADWSERTSRAWRENLDELALAGGNALDAGRVEAWGRFASGFVRRHAAELDARARMGRVVDGHGDLRAEHVVLDEGRVTIVDRLEFDPRLRCVDVADDLAFLVMDLHALGADWAAETLVSAYRDAGGEPGDAALVAGFAVYRALVRAKVAFLRTDQVVGADADQARRSAGHLADVADRLAWTARGPLILVVSGPPASGKSTLASALSRAGDLPVLSSDAVRRSALAVPAGGHAPAEAYTPEARGRIYAELGRGASASLRAGSVVVDATFGPPEHRDAFLGALTPSDRLRLRVIACHAPLEVRVERARRRAAVGGDPSDAGPEVVRRLTGAIAAIPSAATFEVDTAGPPDEAIARVAAWIDTSP